jgi:alpha-tubulin suppressor-like RCC1 family protein
LLLANVGSNQKITSMEYFDKTDSSIKPINSFTNALEVALMGASQTKTAVLSVATGGGHTCAILSDQTVKCWGLNADGQLGDGTKIDRNKPVAVSSLKNVTQIEAGGSHTCALLTDKTVKCWGAAGAPGSGAPVVISDLKNVIQISGGGVFNICALLSDKTVKCWGYNDYGQLGDGSNDHQDKPVAVSDLKNVTQIATGGQHTCALLLDKTVKCWGHNTDGQLGDGTKIDRNKPVAVSDLKNVTQIAAGSYHTCAQLSDQTVKCWGWNGYGQLGDGTLKHATQIAAGELHTCALLLDKTVKCWGRNDFGSLGNGVMNDEVQNVAVSGLTNATQIAADSTNHTCAILSDQKLKCWGRNNSGQLGDGTSGEGNYRSTPVSVRFD